MVLLRLQKRPVDAVRSPQIMLVVVLFFLISVMVAALAAAGSWIGASSSWASGCGARLSSSYGGTCCSLTVGGTLAFSSSLTLQPLIKCVLYCHSDWASTFHSLLSLSQKNRQTEHGIEGIHCQWIGWEWGLPFLRAVEIARGRCQCGLFHPIFWSFALAVMVPSGHTRGNQNDEIDAGGLNLHTAEGFKGWLWRPLYRYVVKRRVC
jgi:hypothetical protein